MRRPQLLLPALVLLAAGCFRETPVRVENKNLGIVAVFPGEPRMHKFTEPSPYGDIDWFSTAYETPDRLDRSFFINVGNLPPGTRGGTTDSQVLATFRQFLTRKMGKIEATDLPATTGPGIRFTCQLLNGDYAEGLVIYRRGRIHWAQATVAKPEDAELKAFLDSFEVMP